jgi:hypothetical protein
MANEPLQHAEAALAELAEQFERWRQTRATAQERIPPILWERAVALAAVLPCAQVARRLRLRSTDLRKRSLAAPAAVATEVAVPIPDFVEVPVPWPGPAPPGITLIEVERPDGTRLRVQYRDAPPLAAVLRAFLEPARCCN